MLCFQVVTATDGTVLDLGSLEITYSYTGSVLDYQEVTYNGNTYRLTYTYTGSNLTTQSAWVKQ